ncbi:hypothetical protein ACLOJK_034280 [Asimina triloba]
MDCYSLADGMRFAGLLPEIIDAALGWVELCLDRGRPWVAVRGRCVMEACWPWVDLAAGLVDAFDRDRRLASLLLVAVQCHGFESHPLLPRISALVRLAEQGRCWDPAAIGACKLSSTAEHERKSWRTDRQFWLLEIVVRLLISRILKGAHLAASDGMGVAQRLADGGVVSWSFIVRIS